MSTRGGRGHLLAGQPLDAAKDYLPSGGFKTVGSARL
jgi:hypothetical protein